MAERPVIDFVSGKGSDNFTCPICCDVAYVRPHKLGCCNAIFCEGCIQRSLSEKMSCPMCRNESPENLQPVEISGELKEQINQLLIYCPNRSKGCFEVLELQQVTVANQHVKKECVICPCSEGDGHRREDCPLRPVMCKRCGKKIHFKNVESHKKEQCLRVKISCQNDGCNQNKVFRFKMESHLKRCQYRSVDCPNKCGIESLKHIMFQEHVSNDCPKRIIACPNQGCDHEPKEAEFINGSHYEVCLYAPLHCLNRVNGCEETMKRGFQREHLDICPKRKVRCKYVEICSQEMLKEDEEMHYRLKMEDHLTRMYKVMLLDREKHTAYAARLVEEKTTAMEEVFKLVEEKTTAMEEVFVKRMQESMKILEDKYEGRIKAFSTKALDLVEENSSKLDKYIKENSAAHMNTVTKDSHVILSDDSVSALEARLEGRLDEINEINEARFFKMLRKNRAEFYEQHRKNLEKSFNKKFNTMKLSLLARSTVRPTVVNFEDDSVKIVNRRFRPTVQRPIVLPIIRPTVVNFEDDSVKIVNRRFHNLSNGRDSRETFCQKLCSCLCGLCLCSCLVIIVNIINLPLRN